jgi:hypothetical protein
VHRERHGQLLQQVVDRAGAGQVVGIEEQGGLDPVGAAESVSQATHHHAGDAWHHPRSKEDPCTRRASGGIDTFISFPAAEVGQVRGDVGEGEAGIDGRPQQTPSWLVDAVHHQRDPVQRSRDGRLVGHVEPPAPRPVSDRRSGGLGALLVSAGHDHLAGEVRGQVGGDPAPDYTVTTDDEKRSAHTPRVYSRLGR